MSEENIEEMSPSKRKMLAKLGKLPAGDQAETSTESEMAETTEDIGDIEEMSPSKRKMLAKLGKLPSDLPSKSRPSKTAAPARKTPTAAKSTATGEVHPLVSGKIKRSVKPKLEFKVERRGWLSLAFGWLAFLLGGIPAFATMILRFLFPNVLFEPPQSFKAGYPDDYTVGAIDETYKEKYGVWIGRTDKYIYALSTVCTHLGCTPNWLSGESKFKCPCHGSGFRKTGVNFEGPAPRPLERHWIGLADDGQIIVDKNIKFQREKGQWESENSYLPWT